MYHQCYYRVAEVSLRFLAKLIFYVVALLPAMALTGCNRGVSADERKTVVVWHPWPRDLAEPLAAIVAAFEKSHPKIHIRLSYAANNLTSNQKLFLAIAGGKAPDVTFVDGQQLAEWAARGALVDITDHVKNAGLSEEDFFAPRWRESTFGGRVYALPWGVDPNFAIAWNKRLFREVGLDPEKPPRTIEELDADNQKLTQIDSSGRIERMGIVPWQLGNDNSLFTWAYAFGGDFYQLPAAGSGTLVGKVTANDPKVVAALSWMAGYAKKYDVRKVSAFQSNFVGSANDPFYLGKIGISLIQVTQLKYIQRYAPGLEFGIAPVPAPPGGEYPSGWLGGWSLAIPRGVKASDEAFEFMRWISASPEGTNAVGRAMNMFPAYRKSPYFSTVSSDPRIAVFYDIARHSTHVRTLMPVQGYLMELLRRDVDEVLYGGEDPQTAMDRVTAAAQSRLQEVMAGVERGRLEDAAAAAR